jgi:hypothetical protein
MMEALFEMSGAENPAEGIGQMFNALTTFEASAYVDADGLVRRIDFRVGFGDFGDTTTTVEDESPFMLDVTAEFWDVGEPLDVEEPAPDEVTEVGDLDEDDIPAQLSPCYIRLS